MIKFFRTFRQKALTENQFGRYLTYAIGEIVLVIIGILIALEINQQAINQSNRESRELYILQLTDEADRNLNQLIEFENITSELIKEVDTLIQLLKDKDYDNPKL